MLCLTPDELMGLIEITLEAADFGQLDRGWLWGLMLSNREGLLAGLVALRGHVAAVKASLERGPQERPGEGGDGV